MLAVERPALCDGTSERLVWHQGERLVAAGDRTIEMPGGCLRRSQHVEYAGVTTVGQDGCMISQLHRLVDIPQGRGGGRRQYPRQLRNR